MSLPCMGEERGRQPGLTVAGRLPVAPCQGAGGPCGRLAVVDEERVLSLLVSPVLQEPVTAQCYYL